MKPDKKERLRRFNEARQVIREFRESFKEDDSLEWLYLGKDLIEKVREWAKDYPDVDAVYFDATYIPSQLVIIMHLYYTDEDKKRYLHSNHIVIIPECDEYGEYDGAEPYEIGLFPEQTSELIDALTNGLQHSEKTE